MDVEGPDVNTETKNMSEMKDSTYMCNGKDDSVHEDPTVNTDKVNGIPEQSDDFHGSDTNGKLKQSLSEASDNTITAAAMQSKNTSSESGVQNSTYVNSHNNKENHLTSSIVHDSLTNSSSETQEGHFEKSKTPTIENKSECNDSSKMVTNANASVSLSPENEKKLDDEETENQKSRSVTPINEPRRCTTPASEKVKSRSATPVNKKASSRSTTPVQKPIAPDNKQAQHIAAEKEKVKKKEIKPSKVTQVLKAASDEVTNLRPIAQMLFDIGMDVTRQYVYRDLIKIQKKKDTMDKLDSKEKQQLEKLQSAYDNLIYKNQSFMNDIITCLHCGFKTDARNILELHKEYAHNQEYNMYTCSFCNETTKVASAFLYHMEAIHNRKGRIFMKHAFFICPYCPYESNNRGPFQKHTEKCMKTFREKNNLTPLAPDCDIPLKAPIKAVPKPSLASEKKVPARPAQKVVSQSVQELQEAHRAQQARLAAQRNTTIAQVTKAIIQKQPNVVPRPPVQYPRSQVTARQITPIPQPPSRTSPVSSAAPVNATSNATGTLVQMNGQWYRLAMVGNQQFLMPVPAPNVNQMPQNRPIVIQSSGGSIPNTTFQANAVQKDSDFEVCEICGGFVKDRDSLRIHFHWAHKVDIHKDIFRSPNPPLACVLCTKAGKNVKFWTYQGLSRHRSFEHKADKENDTPVSSALMNEIPRKCAVCSHLYSNNTTVQQYWSHMEIHGITPVKLFLLKKCLICGQAMDDSKLLEKHLLTNHSLLFRNIALRNAKDSPTKEANKKINKPKLTVCNLCTMSFDTLEAYLRHCNQVHVFQCSRCPDKLSSRETLMKHFHDRHADEKDPCSICHKMIKIGRPMIRHVKSEHVKKCSVLIKRISEAEFKKYRKRKFEETKSASAQESPNRKSNSRRNSENEVIVIDLDSPPKKPVVEKVADGEPHSKKQILEVDGEEIVVEIQQDDSDEEIISESNLSLDFETRKVIVKDNKSNDKPSATQVTDKPDKNNRKQSITEDSNVENIILNDSNVENIVLDDDDGDDDDDDEASRPSVVEENSEDDGEVPKSQESMEIS